MNGPAGPTQREQELAGQTVVVIGGSAGIGLETARRARAEGAGVILTARNPGPLQKAAAELGAQATAAFDATDFDRLARFFQELPTPIDHVLVTGPGPYYAPLADLDRERAHRAFDQHQWLAVAVAQHATGKVRPGGTLLFIGGTGGRARGPGLSLIAAATAAMRDMPGPRPRPPVPPMNSSVPPGRTRPTACLATAICIHKCASQSRCARSRSSSASGA